MSEYIGKHAYAAVFVPFIAVPKASLFCTCVPAWMIQEKGRRVLRTYAHPMYRMCVGSVRVMVGSSSIPTGSASKWFFKKNSASVTLEAV